MILYNIINHNTIILYRVIFSIRYRLLHSYVVDDAIILLKQHLIYHKRNFYSDEIAKRVTQILRSSLIPCNVQELAKEELNCFSASVRATSSLTIGFLQADFPEDDSPVRHFPACERIRCEFLHAERIPWLLENNNDTQKGQYSFFLKQRRSSMSNYSREK